MLIWILVVVALLAQLRSTTPMSACNIYAVGDNATAARLGAFRLNRYILGVYVLCGFVPRSPGSC